MDTVRLPALFFLTFETLKIRSKHRPRKWNSVPEHEPRGLLDDNASKFSSICQSYPHLVDTTYTEDSPMGKNQEPDVHIGDSLA